MKRLLVASLLLLTSCATSGHRPDEVRLPASEHDDQLEAEARILRAEDRREYDRELVRASVQHPDPARRERIALALGRIGTATFDDANGNGSRDPQETAAGVAELLSLASDPVREVRRAAAFAMGESGDPASLEALFKLASDADAEVAATATEALSKIPASVPVDRFQELTSSEHPQEVRVAAVRYLFRLGTDEASSVAAMLLESPDPALRLEAAYTLGRRAFPPARRKLESMLAENDALTRAYAARAIGLIAGADSLRPLSDALEDSHPWVRTNAARSVAQIIDKHPDRLESELAAATGRRLIAMTRDADPGARATAVETLGRFAGSYPVVKERLAELAGGSDLWLREQAALAYAKAGVADSIRALAGDSSPWVRARLLEGSSSLPAGGELRSQLANDPEALVRAAALSAIPEQPVESDRGLVVAALDDSDVVVRATALGKLAAEPFHKLVPRERLTAIEKAERSSDLNDARLAALEALAAIEGEGRESWLAELLADRDPMVRRVAAESLERITAVRRQYTPLPVDRPVEEYAEIARWAAQPHSATIRTQRGDIDLVLLTREAPMTAWNFASLAKKGYFDGTTFMRVVPNFVLQGGDPRNDMSGGPGYAIRDEINTQRYSRGAVGMALSGIDTGGSQFFITHSPQPHLDGGYTVFGHVVSGMADVADPVERGERVVTILIDARPADPQRIDEVSRTSHSGPR